MNFRDSEFVQRLIQRDAIAIEQVVCAYTSHLYKAGLGMGLSDEMANDAAHSTWETFFSIIERFEGRSHIRTFIFGIFYKKVAELRRSNFKFEKHDPIEEIMENKFLYDGHFKEMNQDPQVFSEKVELFEIIEKCIEKLPDQQRAVLSLKALDERDSEEICNILEISATHLRQLLFRGRNRIRECVERLSS